MLPDSRLFLQPEGCAPMASLVFVRGVLFSTLHPPRNWRELPLDSEAALWQHLVMMSGAQKQFSLSGAAPKNCGRANTKSL